MADIFFTLLNRMDFTVFDKRHLTFKTHMLNGRFINSPEHTFCVFTNHIILWNYLSYKIESDANTLSFYYLYHFANKHDDIKLLSFTWNLRHVIKLTLCEKARKRIKIFYAIVRGYQTWVFAEMKKSLKNLFDHMVFQQYTLKLQCISLHCVLWLSYILRFVSWMNKVVASQTKYNIVDRQTLCMNETYFRF